MSWRPAFSMHRLHSMARAHACAGRVQMYRILHALSQQHAQLAGGAQVVHSTRIRGHSSWEGCTCASGACSAWPSSSWILASCVLRL